MKTLTPLLVAPGMVAFHQLPNRHSLCVGSPRSGKTIVELKCLVEEADRGESAIVCIDPHIDSLALNLFAHLSERGHR